MPEIKECPECLRTLSLEDFYAHKPNGRPYRLCKTCHMARTKKAHEVNPARKRESTWKRKYGITGMTEQRYQDLLTAQDGVCKICKRTCGSGRRLSVDHDHASGEVRGLLCLSCNQAIGKIENGTLPLDRLLNYLEPRKV